MSGIFGLADLFSSVGVVTLKEQATRISPVALKSALAVIARKSIVCKSIAAAILPLALAGSLPSAVSAAPQTSSELPTIMVEERPSGSSEPSFPGVSKPKRSIVTKPGVAPRGVEPPKARKPTSPSVIVPGVGSNAGPAMTPPRPPGQSFGDRARNCLQSGAAAGVPAGQLGAYSRNCVNQ